MKPIMKILFFLSIIFILLACNNVNNDFLSQDVITPIGLQDVTVGGEFGRRINVTINNNLLRLNIDEDFISPFQQKDKKGGYIGVGKLIDASVKFAYS